jgi:hypothetical protein
MDTGDGSPGSSAAAAGAGSASAAALMRSLSLGGEKAERRLHIHLRVAHDTKWGEHVVLLGSGGCRCVDLDHDGEIAPRPWIWMLPSLDLGGPLQWPGTAAGLKWLPLLNASAAAGALLGNFNLQRGQALRCHHDQDTLVWELLITLPWQPSYCYRWAGRRLP